MKIIFATGNSGKIIEMKKILSDLEIDVVSMREVGVAGEAVEDAETFEENALKKARFVHQQVLDAWVVADDSGVVIEALDGRPGVHTARWAGEGVSGDGLVQYTLEKMKDIPERKRQASFECGLALIDPVGNEKTFSGHCEGHITLIPQGEAHPKIPYDVIFVPEGYSRSFGEMSAEEKNKLSHRGKAFVKLKEFLAGK